MKKSKRKRSLSSYKRKLWSIFSEFIRRRDSDEDGHGACISCGVMQHYKEMNAGHYYPKSLGLHVLFVEKNVHLQCTYCNHVLQGNQVEYARSLVRKYGEGILEELKKIKSGSAKFSRSDYEELIEQYKTKLKELEARVA